MRLHWVTGTVFYWWHATPSTHSGFNFKNSDHQVSQQTSNVLICQFLLPFPRLQGSQHSFHTLSSLWNLPDVGLITNSGLLATGHFHLSVWLSLSPCHSLPCSDSVLKTTLPHGSAVPEQRVCGCAQPIEKTHCGQARGVPLCLGTLSDTPHALHRARGAHRLHCSWVSLSLLLAVLLVFFFFLDKSSRVAQVFLNALGSIYPSTSASKLASNAWLGLSFRSSLTQAFSTEAAAGLPARGA